MAARDKNAPEPARHPGKKLLEILAARHMSQAELCARMGRARKVINEIIKGKAPISPETAFQLELVLGQPASYWNRLETEYQNDRIRRRHDRQLAANLDWLDEVPLDAMVEARWIERAGGDLAQARALLEWFGVASPEDWRRVYRTPQLGYRRSPAGDDDPGTLAAWLRAGEKQAQEMETAPYNRKRFLDHLDRIRGLTREPADVFQDRMIELSVAAGVALAWARELPGLRVAGASRWLSPRKALIQLSLLQRTDAHLWFAFFHEAAHILLHGKKMVFIEGVVEDLPSRDDVLEEVEADHWAANFLVPHKELDPLQALAQEGKLGKKAVVDFADGMGLAPGIVAHRLQMLGWIGAGELDELKQGLEWAPPGATAGV